ncbi:MAG TPA: DUF2273 domain-containing protein [Halanaerobiales bacterium]|nr:DUF2273 domain-containing protein [Halanaerobiales bacterium]
MDNNYWQELVQQLNRHRGKLIGALIGFIIGLLVLLIGALQTLLIVIFTGLGYFIGSRWDTEGDFRKLLDRILPPQFKD